MGKEEEKEETGADETRCLIWRVFTWSRPPPSGPLPLLLMMQDAHDGTTKDAKEQLAGTHSLDAAAQQAPTTQILDRVPGGKPPDGGGIVAQALWNRRNILPRCVALCKLHA
jgi:hypothetical protein